MGSGGAGWVTIIISADGKEIHPDALVTVNLYVPDESPVIVTVTPVPVSTPGLIVQLPVEGRPFRTTLPVDKAQEGWVIRPTDGADKLPAKLMECTIEEAFPHKSVIV